MKEIQIMSNIQSIIEDAFESRASINPKSVSNEVKEAINETIIGLNNGSLRVASREGSTQNWQTHQWLKKAVLLSFRIKNNSIMDGNYTKYFDKVESKFAHFEEKDFSEELIPYSLVKRGLIAKITRPVYYELAGFLDTKNIKNIEHTGIYSGKDFFILDKPTLRNIFI